MKLEIKCLFRNITGEVQLPESKSFLNRYLILKHLSNTAPFHPSGQLPEDVHLMMDALRLQHSRINAGDAGTAMRFMTAVLSISRGKWRLEGSERMNHRPIGPLVTALNQLGADIRFAGQKGFPPLEITGRLLKGGEISIDSAISSQFISAIMLIAPLCEAPVKINFIGQPVSLPYIDMTAAMMKQFGIVVVKRPNQIAIEPGRYLNCDLTPERDWSAAAFFYQVCALADSCDIYLPGLSKDVVQGDKRVMDFFAGLGVETIFEAKNTRLKKNPLRQLNDFGEIDLTDTPDLFQPLVFTYAGLGKGIGIKGLYNLHLKESDRIKAVSDNLRELGTGIVFFQHAARISASTELKSSPHFDSFGDHRMAMSLAPVSLKVGRLSIENGNVVSKSFPDYWDELKKLGFEITEIA